MDAFSDFKQKFDTQKSFGLAKGTHPEMSFKLLSGSSVSIHLNAFQLAIGDRAGIISSPAHP